MEYRPLAAVSSGVASLSFEFTAARDSHTNPTLLGVHPRQLSADAALSLSGSRAQNSLFSPLAHHHETFLLDTLR